MRTTSVLSRTCWPSNMVMTTSWFTQCHSGMYISLLSSLVFTELNGEGLGLHLYASTTVYFSVKISLKIESLSFLRFTDKFKNILKFSGFLPSIILCAKMYRNGKNSQSG